MENKTILSKLTEKMKDNGYLTDQIISEIAKELSVSESEVFGVATFYSFFTFKKPAKFNIVVCTGTACYVLGAGKIIDAIKEYLKIDMGQTTDDGMFSLNEARCFGCCSVGPVVKINDVIYEKQDERKILKVLEGLKNEN